MPGEERARSNWALEFYGLADGREPCRDWLDRLSETKRDALLAALTHVLARLGPDVCKSEWGKPLGAGLYEFRVRHTAEETAGMFAGELRGGSSGQAILLRVFFHPYGKKVILLLGGYDKAKEPSQRRQQREIETARSYLASFLQAQRSHRPPP